MAEITWTTERVIGTAISILGGGVGLKILEHVLGRHANEFVEARQIRDELRQQIESLQKEIDLLKKEAEQFRREADEWRQKYWDYVQATALPDSNEHKE